MEVDREFEPLPIAEAARGILDPLDLRVEPPGYGIGDPMVDVVEHILSMATDNPVDMDHRPETRPHGPRLPAVEEGATSIER